MMVACVGDAYVWALQDGATPRQIPLPAGHTNGNLLWMVQAFNILLLLQLGTSPVKWDGVAATFTVVTKLNPLDLSTNVIPNVDYGVSFANRMLYVDPNQRDRILMSDVLDYTSYDPVAAVFRINAGEADQIGAIVPYNNESVIVFMQHSIHLLSNFTIDPTQAIQQVVTRQVGLVPAPTNTRGRKAWAQVGGDILFLSNPGGIYRLSQVWESRVMGQPVPVSDLIQPLINDIRWDPTSSVGWTNAIVHGIYCYWALPFVNIPAFATTRGLLVYNTATGQFESLDTWPFLAGFNAAITDLIVTNYGAQRRLFAIEGINKSIRLLEEGTVDYDTSGVAHSIQDVMETRGFGWGSASGPGSLYGIQRQSGPGSEKRFDRLSIAMRTVNPSASVYAISDGFQEVKQLRATPITKSNTTFYTWGHKKFNPATDNALEPERQDYTGTTDSTTGMDAKTESLERMTIRKLGRWCAIRIINTQGSCDVVEISVEAREAKRNVRVAA